MRYLRDPDTQSGKRVEPWSIVFTDLADGTILDVVDGRRGKGVTTWLAARPRWWRRRVQIVALDMSSEFRAAVRKARVSVDHWHVVQMITKVRRRRVWELHERRGRAIDTPWKKPPLAMQSYPGEDHQQRSQESSDNQRDCPHLSPSFGVISTREQ